MVANLLIVPVLVFTAAAFGESDVRECAGPDRWAAQSAETRLRNDGVFRPEEIDYSKTQVTLLAQEKIKRNLYRQIQKIVFVKKTGEEIVVITDNEASPRECSMTAPDIYLINKVY